MALTTLPVNMRTAIDNSSKIIFSNSPIKLLVPDLTPTNPTYSAEVSIWVWKGNLTKPLGLPNYILKKSKVTPGDKYIEFDISDIIRSAIVTLSLFGNIEGNSFPTFKYSGVSQETEIEGEGIFYQIGVETTYQSYSPPFEDQHRYYEYTRFATLGYKWNTELGLQGSNGVEPGGSLGFLTPENPLTGELTKYYNPLIPRYQSAKFNLTPAIEGVTSNNVIIRQDIDIPKNLSYCTRDPYLLVYLNKLGLWETFTPFGKCVISTKTTSEVSPRSYRNQGNVNTSIYSGKGRSDIDVIQSYSINTGGLTEEMDQLVEELIYSSRIYLIKFKGDKVLIPSIGEELTVDSTLFTVDNTIITADNTLAPGFIGTKLAYKDFYQVPVIVKDTDFTRRTRLYDKTNINYTIVFDETYNKIN